MLIGKRFSLNRATVAVRVIDRRRTAFTVPAGAIISVLPDPADCEELVTVLWEGYKLELQMFVVDLDARATEIKAPQKELSRSYKTATA
jgi:hypothetical protein